MTIIWFAAPGILGPVSIKPHLGVVEILRIATLTAKFIFETLSHAKCIIHLFYYFQILLFKCETSCRGSKLCHNRDV